jgi:hypothetical protein
MDEKTISDDLIDIALAALEVQPVVIAGQATFTQSGSALRVLAKRALRRAARTRDGTDTEET